MLSLPVLVRRFRERTRHEFWPDDLSLLDGAIVDVERIFGYKQLTDVYLLALAVKHGGRFVTFDDGIPLAAVKARILSTSSSWPPPSSGTFSAERRRTDP